MPKIARALEAIEVQRLVMPGFHAVGAPAGLHLKVAPSPDPRAVPRWWVLRTMVAGVRRDFGLGPYPEVSLAKAREKAVKLKAEVREGRDPAAEKAKARSARKAKAASAQTFARAADEYIARRSTGWRNPKHGDQWRATLATYAMPVLGDMLVEDIRTEHVLAVLEPIWSDKAETASRVRNRIELVIDAWAARRDLVGRPNPARWRGGLDKLLTQRSKVAPVEHFPAVPLGELGAFMRALGQRRGAAASALAFAILTASRSGAVRLAEWNEFDLDEGVWTVPAAHMKAGKEFRIPLSQRALDLLRALPRFEGNPLVFPAPRGGVLSDMAMLKTVRSIGATDATGKTATVHGFRSCFRDWAGELTAHPVELVRQCMAHTVSDKVDAAYRRGDGFERRRAVMHEWAEFLAREAEAPAPAEVIPLAPRRAAAASR